MPKLKKTSGTAAIIALVSVAVPFLLGTFALAPHLYENGHSMNGSIPIPKLSFDLFVGTCMSVTAFPVLARIITEKGLQKLQLGSMTLACAALNDVVAWALLAVVLAVQQSQSSGGGGSIDYAPVLIELALILVVIVAEFLVVAPLMRITVFNHYKRTGSLSPNRLAWVLIGMFLSAWLVHHIGFHAMLGSFTFGLVFPRGYGTPFLYTILSKIEPFATLVLLPLFFMVTGLSIDLSQLGNTGYDLLWILLVASGGKFLGSAIPAKLAGVGWRHSIAVGVMMNTRGLTEIVVLNIGAAMACRTHPSSATNTRLCRHSQAGGHHRRRHVHHARDDGHHHHRHGGPAAVHHLPPEPTGEGACRGHGRQRCGQGQAAERRSGASGGAGARRAERQQAAGGCGSDACAQHARPPGRGPVQPARGAAHADGDGHGAAVLAGGDERQEHAAGAGCCG
jgi:Kef-type K+ transport system membrane component KefB